MLIKIRGLNNMATFGDAERNIQRLLAIGQSFVLSGVDYIIRKSGKPTCSKGEPKTDCEWHNKNTHFWRRKFPTLLCPDI